MGSAALDGGDRKLSRRKTLSRNHALALDTSQRTLSLIVLEVLDLPQALRRFGLGLVRSAQIFVRFLRKHFVAFFCFSDHRNPPIDDVGPRRPCLQYAKAPKSDADAQGFVTWIETLASRKGTYCLSQASCAALSAYASAASRF